MEKRDKAIRIAIILAAIIIIIVAVVFFPPLSTTEKRSVSYVAPTCGNGVVQAGEECESDIDCVNATCSKCQCVPLVELAVPLVLEEVTDEAEEDVGKPVTKGLPPCKGKEIAEGQSCFSRSFDKDEIAGIRCREFYSNLDGIAVQCAYKGFSGRYSCADDFACSP